MKRLIHGVSIALLSITVALTAIAGNGELRLQPIGDRILPPVSPRIWQQLPRMQYWAGPKIQQAGYMVIDSLFNAFSYYGSNQTCVLWEPQTRTFITIKRGALPPSQTTTDHGNNIFILWSTDQGQSWQRLGPVLEGTRGVLAPNGAPRYPALAVLYGDAEVSSLEGSAFTYFSPITDGSNWSGLASGYIPIGAAGALPNNLFLDGYDDTTPENQQYFHSFGTTVNTTSFSLNSDAVYGFGMTTLFPSPSGSAPSSQNNNIGIIKVDVFGLDQFMPMIPAPLRSTNFADPQSTTARTNSEVGLDIDQERNLYAGVFGRFATTVNNDPNRTTFGVAKSTDGGVTWSELNIMPTSVIDAYAAANGAVPDSSGFTFSWAWNNTTTRVTAAKDFVVTGVDRYSFVGQFMLVANGQIIGVHYVEAYYENGQWGIRKIADASLFETLSQWSFDTGSDISPSQLGCELQISRTADYSTLLFKTLEAKIATVNGGDYITTDVVVSRRSIDGNSWDALRNATASDIVDRITWLPKVVPNGLSGVPLLTVQAASREGTEWDYLWTNQFRLAAATQSPTPDEVLRYRQYVTYSTFDYSSLPSWLEGSTVEPDASGRALVITPNPATEQVTIACGDRQTLGGGTLTLVNMLGAVVKHVELVPNQAYYTLDVADLPSGVYAAHLRSGATTLTTTVRIVR
jgi:hypothetical protein